MELLEAVEQELTNLPEAEWVDHPIGVAQELAVKMKIMLLIPVVMVPVVLAVITMVLLLAQAVTVLLVSLL
jgi:hypothetical protein